MADQYANLVNQIASEYGSGWFYPEDLARDGLGDAFTCDTLFIEGYLIREPIKELSMLQIFNPESFKYKLRKKRKVSNEDISGRPD